jgi:hypothetical protein
VTFFERMRDVRTSRRPAWESTPMAMRMCFYGAVFALFASFGALALLTSNTYVPPLLIALNLVITGGFAVGYAAVSVRQKYWLIPIIGVAEGIVFVFIDRRYPTVSELIAGNSPLHRQMQLLAAIGMISVVVGYTLFIVYFYRQGARYFRAHNEIAMAGEIHRALVPPIHKTIGSFELYGVSIPSGEVGGDLVDVAEDGPSWTGYVADVSGHGVSAGLLMAMFKTAVRTRAKDASAAELLAEVHRVLYPLKTPNMFATVGVLQCAGTDFNLALAGHPPLLHYVHSCGEVREYPSTDLPLGVLPEQAFSATRVGCQSGDLLVLITDGLTEVFDKTGSEMGIGPIKQALRESAKKPLPELSANIRQTALNFGRQDDDQTMLIVRCL